MTTACFKAGAHERERASERKAFLTTKQERIDKLKAQPKFLFEETEAVNSHSHTTPLFTPNMLYFKSTSEQYIKDAVDKMSK